MGTLNQGFQLSEKSLAELNGVHPDLVAVVQRAIQLTRQDFAVHDGLRTIEEQRKLVAAGASRSLASRHLTGRAVDLVPVINGKLRWEWAPIYLIADAMRTAAQELNVQVRWGGNWGNLAASSCIPPEDLVDNYVDSRRKQGKSAFVDGPHFEIMLPEEYPGLDPKGLGSAWQGAHP